MSRSTPGPVPLLPSQLRWAGHRFDDPDHFVREWVFDVPRHAPDGTPVDAERIGNAVRALTDRHDALRTRYLLDDAAGPSAAVLPAAPDGLLEVADIDDSGVPAALQRGMTSHRLDAGRVLTATWLPRQRLLQVSAHNLTLDGYSITLLPDQLEQLLTGREPAPPASQPRDWGADLATWLGTAQAADDSKSWASLGWDAVRPVPTESSGPGLLSSMASDSARLDAAHTEALQRLSRELDQPVDLLVLTAAGRVIADHFRLPAVSVDIYHHGRDGIPGGHDVTGTFGYLQCTYPVVVPSGAGPTPLTRMDHLSGLPEARFGYDAMRAAGHDALAGLPGSDVRLVFRSRLNQMNTRDGRWLRPAPMSGPARRSPRQRDPQRFVLHADLNAEGLLITTSYSRDLYRPDTARSLANTVVAALATATGRTSIMIPRQESRGIHGGSR